VAAHKDATGALETLERRITEGNDFDNVEERDQRRAEVGAARRLFEALRIRVEPLVALLRPLVVKFGEKLEDNLMNIAVAAVIAALTVLFGRIF
jgi:hypothetical protein